MYNKLCLMFFVLVVGEVWTTSIFYYLEEDGAVGFGNVDSRKNNLKISRVSRQGPIVQPDLTPEQIFGGLFKDYNVHVTDEKLEETEAIRELIQDTVETGTYAVEMDESDFKEDNGSDEPVQLEELEPGIPLEADLEHESESEPEPEAEREPEPAPEPESEPEQEAEHEHQYVPAPEHQPELQTEPKMEPQNGVRPSLFSKLKQKPRKARKFRIRGVLKKWLKDKCFFGKC